MKICNILLESKMIQIGDLENIQGALWYYMPDNVLKWVSSSRNSYKVGDEVIIQHTFENGKYILTRINKANSQSSESQNKTGYNSAPKNNAERPVPLPSNSRRSTDEKIDAQNTLHCVSRALIALQGQVDINNIIDVSTTLYNHFQNLKDKDGNL